MKKVGPLRCLTISISLYKTESLMTSKDLSLAAKNPKKNEEMMNVNHNILISYPHKDIRI